MKLVHVTTVPGTLKFLANQPAHLAAHGHEVVLISSPGPALDQIATSEGARAIPLPMARSIALRDDLRSLISLVRTLRQVQPDILHAHTPKAGLLATIAGRLTRVPICIYQIHGLRFITATGARRLILKCTERITCTLAHQVLCVSPSVLGLAEDEHVIRRGKGQVIGSGTINGVDVTVFDPTLVRQDAGAVRATLGIPADAPVIGFVGRLAADKGVAELAAAWSRIRETVPNAHLVAVGGGEANDPVDPEVIESLRRDVRVHLVGHQPDVRPYYGMMSVLVLPSAREGFPQTLLEGSAMGLVTVGSDVPGVSDAIQDGRTGLLFPVHDVDALVGRLLDLLKDPARREEMGDAGRRRAMAEFDQREVRELFFDYYLETASARNVDTRGRASADPLDGVLQAGDRAKGHGRRRLRVP